MNSTLITDITSFDKFKIFDGNIGCSISGGADSTILMYLLMKFANKPVKFYSAKSTLLPNRAEAALACYNKCVELTGCTTSELILTEYDVRLDSTNIFSKPIEDKANGIIDVIYTGITKAPGVVLDFSEEVLPRRVFDGLKPELDSDNFYQPFINDNKTIIKDLYVEFDLLDSLYSITFSCIKSTTLTHCEKCWWCSERFWAFGRMV